MAFTASLYTFSKKGNSTAQPSGGNSFSCTLKEPCSVLNPVIRLDYSGNPTEYNYAYIPEFGRYYYIRDWVYTLGLWDANLDADVLASWKSYIGSTSCYVVRAANASNGNIVDTMYPVVSNSTKQTQSSSSPWVQNINGGQYIVGIAGETTNFYAMPYSVFESLVNYIFSDSYLDDVMNDWADVYPEIRTQVNPSQFIKSIMVLPYAQDVPGNAEVVSVGWVRTNVMAANVSESSYISGNITFPVPSHPQASSRGQYLNRYSLSSNYSVFFPPFGRIDLPSSDVGNTESIICKWRVDIRTGIGYLVITDIEDNVLSTAESLVSIPVQINDLQSIGGYGAASLISAVGDTVSSLATMTINPVMGGIRAVESIATNVVTGIGEGLKSEIPRVSTVGSNGGMSSLIGDVNFQAVFRNVVNSDLANRGAPYCSMSTPASLGGYMLCSNVAIEFPGTDAELSRVKYIMESGFYYE